MSDLVIIPEIQIDFENIHDAISMETYANNKLNLRTMLTETTNSSVAMLSIYNVPENKLASIRRRCAIESFSRSTVKIIDVTRNVVVGTADFAAYKVITPVAQASIKASADIAKVVVKSSISTAATVVGYTIETVRKTKEELKGDTEMAHAKSEIANTYKSIKNFFGFTGSNTNNIRTIKTVEQPARVK